MNKTDNNNINEGDILEYRLKRLLFHMGYFTQNNIRLKTAPQEPCEDITDLDVFGTLFSNDYSVQTTWVDCKSGQAEILKHISWMYGIMRNVSISNAIFIKKSVRMTAKNYAHTLGIKVFDMNVLENLEDKFNVKKDIWSGNYDYNYLINLPKIFSKINVPENKHFKNIYLFYSSSYWTMDPYTQVKKCISGLKQLGSYYNMPLKSDEKLSIKWMIYNLINLFLLSTYKICGQVFFYDEKNKKSMVYNGFNSGGIPIAKQKEIRDNSIKLASELIKQVIPDFNENVFTENMNFSIIPPLSYFDAYFDLLSRIMNDPIKWNDILRKMDYFMMEFELKEKKISDTEEILSYNSDTISLIKTVIYFLINICGLRKETFSVLFSI